MKKRFDKWRILTTRSQRPYKRQILQAFDALLRTDPSERQFSDALQGITLFPEMLYRLTIKVQNRRRSGGRHP